MGKENDEKSALVPRRRFPEFREADNWKLEPLGRLAKRRTAKNVKGEHARVLTNSAEFGVVDQRDYFEKDIANQGNLEGYYIVEKGDYVYNPRISTSAPVGPISRNNVGTGVMSPLYTVFRFVSSDNDFFAHYFKSTHWHRYMRQASSTGARHDRMSITNDDFMGLPLPVSAPKEQQKIADCLSSLDELVTAETHALAALKTHKKGLMQQLFPREGETVPRLRFPEFREAGDWRFDPLSTFVSALDAGVSVNAGDRPAMPEEIGVLKTSCVTNGVFELSENKVVLEPEELERVTECVRRDTIIISRMNTLALVGASAYVEHDGANIFLPDRLWAAKPAPNANMRFIAYILGSDRGRRALSELAAGSSGSMKNIAKAAVLELLISTPESAEQQKIVDCLSSLDDLITAQSQKIDALKTHKKGLMQQLFPMLEEMHA